MINMEAIILIGIQASGKTTFYQQRFLNTHIRISLDMLKTQNRELILLKACMAAKQSFVIDNTNISKEHRRRYIELVKPAGFQIVGYFFDSEVRSALARNRQRVGKAKIPAPGIFATLKRLQNPTNDEGFDQLYSVSINDSNEFVIKKSSA